MQTISTLGIEINAGSSLQTLLAMRQRLDENAAAAARLDVALRAQEAAVAQSTRSLAGLSSVVDAAKRNLEGVGAGFRAAGAPTVAFRRQVDDVAGAMGGMAAPATSFRKAISESGDAMAGVGQNTRSLIYSFNGLAATSLGVSQSFGTLFSNLAPWLIGGTATAGVLLGVTVLGRVFRSFGDDLESAKKKAKEAREEIERLDAARRGPANVAFGQVGVLQSDERKAQARVTDLTAVAQQFPGDPSITIALTRATRDLADAQAKLRQSSLITADAQQKQAAAAKDTFAEHVRTLATLRDLDPTNRQYAKDLQDNVAALTRSAEAARGNREEYARLLGLRKTLTDAEASLTKQQDQTAKAAETYIAGLARQVAGEQAAVVAIAAQGTATASAAQESERARAVAEALTHVTETYSARVTALVNAQYDAKEMAAALTASQKTQAEQFERTSTAAKKLADSAMEAAKHYRDLQKPAVDTTTPGGVINQIQAIQQKQQEAEAKASRSAIESAKQIQDNFLHGLQDTVGKGFADIFEHGLSGAKSFWDAFKRLALETFGQIASAAVLRQLAGSALGGALGIAGSAAGAAAQTGGTLSRTFSIGMTGAQGAVPVAASASIAGAGGASAASLAVPIVGGLVALTGVVLGVIAAHKAAKEAAEQMAKAQLAFAADLGQFQRDALGLTTPLQAAFDAIAKQADALRKAAEDAYKGQQNSVDLSIALNYILNAQRDANARAAEAQTRATNDFLSEQQARVLTAGGQTDAADALRRQVAATKELDDAVKQYGETVRAAVKAAQDAEEAERQRQAAEQRTLSRNDFSNSVATLGAQAVGDTRTEFVLGVTQNAAQTAKGFTDMARAGVISFEELTSALGLLNVVTAKQVADYDAQVKQQHDASLADAQARTLAAQGRSADADAMRISIQYENELAEARKQGADVLTATIAAQEAETKARAQAAAIQTRTDRAGYDSQVATLEGRDRDAFWVQQREQVAQQIDAYARLRAAGTITSTEFDHIAGLLNDSVSSSARAAADALDALQKSMSALQQQASDADKYFSATNATPDQQEAYYAQLYGFAGQSRDDVVKTLTAPSVDPTHPLSPEQQAANQRAYDFLTHYDQAEAQKQQSQQSQSSAVAGSGATAGAGASFLQGATSSQIDRYGHIAETQLAVLREIEANTRLFGGAMGGSLSLAPTGGTLKVEVTLHNGSPDSLTIDPTAADALGTAIARGLTPDSPLTVSMQRNITARATRAAYRRGSSGLSS